MCVEKNIVGEARERERERGGGEARAGAVQSWNGHPELSLPCVAIETTFLPRLHPYRLLWLSFTVSLSLCLSVFHSSFNLCLCFSLSDVFTHIEHIHDDARSASMPISSAVPSLWQGEWVIAQFILHSGAHGHISISLVSQHLCFPLSIFTPPSVQHHASVMPPLVIYPHTGYLSTISP